MKSIKQIISEKAQVSKNKYVSREFQDYGFKLAAELGDLEHKSLYIRLAKTVERKYLEQARSFAIDSTARSKGALFMWKLKELRGKAKKKDNVV
jgi:hypothetical protein